MKKYVAIAVVTAIMVCLQVSVGQAAPKWKTYTTKDGAWSISYPADQLKIEQKQGVTIFIGKDRRTVLAVDSFVAKGDLYGNTGENLRNRAQDALEIVYDKDVQIDQVLNVAQRTWETGLTYSTDKGSTGAAYYHQRGRSTGDYWVLGVIYGYDATNEAAALPLLVRMRDSFTQNVKASTKDFDQARAALKAHLNALQAGRYTDAAALFGGTNELVKQWFPDGNPNNIAGLLEQGCTTLLFRCAKVRVINKGVATSATQFTFLVQFNTPEGNLLTMQLPQSTPVSQFSFDVRKDGKRFVVESMPLYLP